MWKVVTAASVKASREKLPVSLSLLLTLWQKSLTPPPALFLARSAIVAQSHRRQCKPEENKSCRAHDADSDGYVRLLAHILVLVLIN